MVVKVSKKAVEGLIEISGNKTETKTKTEKVGEVTSDQPTASVGFSASYTKNLGNYESVKVAVTLFMPVPIDFQRPYEDIEEALDVTFMQVQSWVDGRMKSTLDDIGEKSG